MLYLNRGNQTISKTKYATLRPLELGETDSTLSQQAVAEKSRTPWCYLLASVLRLNIQDHHLLLLLLLVSQAGWRKSVIILAVKVQRNKGSFMLRKMELLLFEEVGSPIAFELLILIFLFLG